MTPFHVGMKVACVDDEARGQYLPPIHSCTAKDLDGLTKGNIYTIRGFYTGNDPDWTYGCGSIYLEEIHRSVWGGEEAPFAILRFRPLVKTNIEIFTSMLAPKQKERKHEPAA